jgi:pimeloyl-ACP methyl ester carboxylesterase
MKRRSFLSTAACCLAAAVAPGAVLAQAAQSRFILIHGAMHGAWCWYKVLPRLLAAGRRALAIDLPGHGRNYVPRAEQTRQAYVDNILAAIDESDGAVVLVAHDLGGIIASLVAEARPGRVAQIIYLAGYLPRPAQSVLQLVQRDRESLVPKRSIVAKDRASIMLRDDALQEVLYADCSAEDVSLARLSYVAEATQPYGAPVALGDDAFGRVPKDYVLCAQDRAVGPQLQRFMAEAGGCRRVISLESGHAPFFSQPDTLTTALLELAP